MSSRNLTIDGVQLSNVTKIKALDTDTQQLVSFVDTSDATASASDIVAGKSAYVNGTKLNGTGTRATLFSPIITSGINTISWENDSRNGGFNVTILASIDGTTVQSPLTITEAMDGKLLVITASATGFNDAVENISIIYYPDLPGTTWQFNDTVTDDQLITHTNYWVSGTIYANYNNEEMEISVRLLVKSTSWNDFITLEPTDKTTDPYVLYFTQYNWYLRYDGSQERLLIPAPRFHIDSVSSIGKELEYLTNWLLSNAVRIRE